MPIRMTDDPQDQNQQDYNDDQGGGGGGRSNIPGGGIGALLPLLLGLFKGKGIIVLLILGVGAYFLLGRGGGNMQSIQDTISRFSPSGDNFDAEEFNKANVYEGLDDDKEKNPLPEAVSLLQFAPPRGDP